MSTRRQCLFGLETEYAVSCCSESGRRSEEITHRAACSIVEHARDRLPHLTAQGRGIFVCTGGRLYVDPAGAQTHLEYATPECTTPCELVLHALAGDRIVSELAESLERTRADIGRLKLAKTNVCGATGNSWASHENHLTHKPLTLFPRHIVPHLVSRVIFTGGGGMDVRASDETRFVLSPRALMVGVAAGFATEIGRRRPLFHTKEEPLTLDGKHHRLHVLTGESLCTVTAQWLRFATTALVVALIDAGEAPGEAVALAKPVEALHTFACDTTLGARVPLAVGGTRSALEIQRHYLALAGRHAGSDSLPEWAPEACRVWRETLDALENGGAAALARTLDWPMKQHLFGEAAPGASRARLFEMDWRFCELGGRSLHAAVRGTGLMRDLVPAPSAAEIHAATRLAPAGTRARLRGGFVAQHTGNPCYTVEWNGILDKTRLQWLDLNDPFASAPLWVKATALTSEWAGSQYSRLTEMESDAPF